MVVLAKANASKQMQFLSHFSTFPTRVDKNTLGPLEEVLWYGMERSEFTQGSNEPGKLRSGESDLANELVCIKRFTYLDHNKVIILDKCQM